MGKRVGGELNLLHSLSSSRLLDPSSLGNPAIWSHQGSHRQAKEGSESLGRTLGILLISHEATLDSKHNRAVSFAFPFGSLDHRQKKRFAFNLGVGFACHK
ncbi:hypothetical protein [Ruegeria sp.]|uniref:hypothetical protein n=1 Tax=Ruegeria sp. TaxID=1879320 RepID=UPI003C7EA39D